MDGLTGSPRPCGGGLGTHEKNCLAHEEEKGKPGVPEKSHRLAEGPGGAFEAQTPVADPQGHHSVVGPACCLFDPDHSGLVFPPGWVVEPPLSKPLPGLRNGKMQGSPTENDEPEMTPENKNVAEFHQDFHGSESCGDNTAVQKNWAHKMSGCGLSHLGGWFPHEFPDFGTPFFDESDSEVSELKNEGDAECENEEICVSMVGMISVDADDRDGDGVPLIEGQQMLLLPSPPPSALVVAPQGDVVMNASPVNDPHPQPATPSGNSPVGALRRQVDGLAAVVQQGGSSLQEGLRHQAQDFTQLAQRFQGVETWALQVNVPLNQLLQGWTPTQESVYQARHQLAETQGRLEGLEERLNETYEGVSNLASRLRGIQTAHQETLAQHEEALGFHEQGLEDVNREIQTLAYLEIPAAKVPAIEEGLGILQSQVADMAAALHRMDGQQKDAAAELAQQKLEVSRLQADHQRALQHDQQLSAALMGVQEELQRLTLQVATLGQSPSTQGHADEQLLSALKSSQGHIKSLDDKLEEQRCHMERMQKEHAAA